MTNERALEEFRFAVNQWFHYMDAATRDQAVKLAIEALQLPVGEVLHQEVVVKKPSQGRGLHLSEMFTGKVWMLNRSTGERARVEPSEVAAYAAKGFVRGGPRSK